MKAVGPLRPGEQAEVATSAQLVSVRGAAASSLTQSLAMSTVTGLLGFGVLSLTVPRIFGLLLTNQRLILLEANQNTGAVKPTVVADLPRDEIRAASMPTGRVQRCFDLHDRQGHPVLTLCFPLVNRAESEELALSLGAPRA